jgi:phosphohistidine phosphatase
MAQERRPHYMGCDAHARRGDRLEVELVEQGGSPSRAPGPGAREDRRGARGPRRGGVRRLLLLRHASAARGAPDAARALDARGRAEAERIAARLAGLGAPPAAALCSPARRARETFEAVRRALDPAPALRLEDALYLASPSAILAVLGGLAPAVESALVVGHNPGLEDLARALARAGDPVLRRALRSGLAPAALAVLDVDADDWRALEGAPARLVAFEAP